MSENLLTEPNETQTMITSTAEIKFPWTIAPIPLWDEYNDGLDEFTKHIPAGLQIVKGTMTEYDVIGEIRSMEDLEKILNLRYPGYNHHIIFTCSQEDSPLYLELDHEDDDTAVWEQSHVAVKK